MPAYFPGQAPVPAQTKSLFTALQAVGSLELQCSVAAGKLALCATYRAPDATARQVELDTHLPPHAMDQWQGIGENLLESLLQAVAQKITAERPANPSPQR